MLARILLGFALVVVNGTGVAVAQDEFVPKVGDNVVVQLRHGLGKEYIQMKAEQAGGATLDPEFGIDLAATITQILPDGLFEVEQSSAVYIKNGVTRMFTLSATIDPKDAATNIKVRKIPAGTLIYYPSPNGVESRPNKSEIRTIEIDLSNAKTKLRTWVLADEKEFNQ